MIMILRDWENIYKSSLFCSEILTQLIKVDSDIWWKLIIKRQELSHLISYFKGYLSEDHVKTFMPILFYPRK